MLIRLQDGIQLGQSGGVKSFNGRTGIVLPEAGDYTKVMIGLGNVDNTSDLDKPISTATQAALDLKANASDIPAPYSLPIASSQTLGGIKVGTNLTIDQDGTLNAQSGGVSDYEDLSNQPQINGVTLVGNKSLADLGIEKASVEVTGTLTAGQTGIALSNVAITTSSTVDVYTDVFCVNPTSVLVVSGSVVLTFTAQASNLGVKVVVR